MILSYKKKFYKNSSPGLKSFSLRCVEADIKVYILSVFARESTKSKGAYFLTPLTTLLRLGREWSEPPRTLLYRRNTREKEEYDIFEG